MVVFTCNHCGDSVKKPAVEKHYNTKCRNQSVSVSCMDCQKDFLGKEHVAHTKCITEAEKYSGKDFVPKANKNANAKKQDNWLEVVRSILQNTDCKMNDSARAAFQKLQHHENVPRKKAKFENFATKCLHMPKAVLRDVWMVLEKELNEMEEARKQEQEAKKQEQEAKKSMQNGDKRKATENGNAEEPATKKKKQTQAENGATEAVEPAKKKKKQKQAENGATKDEEQADNDAVEPATKKKKQKQAENGATEAVEPAKKKKKLQQAENGATKDEEQAENNAVEPATKKKKQKQAENCATDSVEPAKKKKKQQQSSETELVTEASEVKTTNTNGADDAEEENFKWLDVLEKLVRKQGDAGIELEKLQSKVLKKYQLKLGLETLTPKLEKKFAKKFTKHLKNCSNVTIDNNVAKVA